MATATAQMNDEALDRAQNGQSVSNYPTIYAGFEALGIATAAILPRINIFSYRAWKAKGRQVRRGEHGVKVVTYLPTEKKVKQPDGSEKIEHGKRPWRATVFHISQTDSLTA
ncbi:MAG: DUF1738 domain-containing protein [Planctomycetes bacterium]|nr:DUF1738 domain-containing protein [Planctomycetota bacterium]